MLNPGDAAPLFSLPDADGRDVRLADFRDKWVVLYFYPKDNTSGCTKEAVDFTSLADAFADLNAVVIGVSPDAPASHRKFIEKHGLGILLLSDPEKKVIGAYGAWGLKKNYGKEYEGLIRSTFLIAPGGAVAAAWTKVRVRVKRKSGEVRHADQVLEKLKEVSGG